MKNGNFSDDLILNNYQQSYCLANQTALIGGRFSSDYFSNLRFSIIKCNNATSQIRCKPKEQIDAFFDGAYFEFYFIDRYVDSSNYTNPFQYFFNTYFITLDPDSFKYVDMYFKTVNVVSDNGLLFQTTYTESEIMLDYVREQFSVYQASKEVIAFHINSSNNMVNINRYYMKIQDLAATIGGILKICLVVGLVISKFFNDYIMLETVLNTLYNFDTKNDLFVAKEGIEDKAKLSEKISTILLQKRSKLAKELGIFDMESKLGNMKSPITLKTANKNENLSGIIWIKFR